MTNQPMHPTIQVAGSAWQRQAIAPTVFVVDDDQDIRELIAQTLLDEGYFVVPLADGEQALAALLDSHPALMLLDLMMPNLSGWEVLRRLRAETITELLPVVLISASRDLEGTSAQFGANACLAKPFELDQLVDLVRAYAGPPQANQ